MLIMLSLTSRLYESWVELFLRNVWPACWVWEFIRPLSCQQDGTRCDCAGQQTAPCPSVQPVFLAWWKIQGQEFGSNDFLGRMPAHLTVGSFAHHCPKFCQQQNDSGTSWHSTPNSSKQTQKKITTNNVFENKTSTHAALKYDLPTRNILMQDTQLAAVDDRELQPKALRHLIKTVWMPNLMCIYNIVL